MFKSPCSKIIIFLQRRCYNEGPKPYRRFDRDGGYNSRDSRGSFQRSRESFGNRGGGGGRGELMDSRLAGSGGSFRQRDSWAMNRSLTKQNWDNMETINKDFYEESPTTKARTEQEVQTYRQQHHISVSGRDAKRPIQSFEEAGFPDGLMKTVIQQKYSALTPIQAQGLPIALSGRDMVGVAQTGSGKTFSFIAPGIVHIMHQKPLQPGEGPVVLVLAPTRELSMQIVSVAETFGRPLNIRNLAAYGGVGKGPQLGALRGRVDICVATPGRLIDLLECGMSLRRCSYVVLDEADRMLDMGFEPQIKQIFPQIHPNRQVLMWSATWPREIRNLANSFLKDYVHVTVGSLELSANPDIKQVVDVCQEDDKVRRLLGFLKENVTDRTEKVLIFSETKRRVSQLTELLLNNGFQAEEIHGDRTQQQRDFAMNKFRNGKCNVLVATDVAARGLDVDDIKCVVNFDCPKEIESYIHRIGRTGRCGKAGLSYTLFTEFDSGMKRGLKSVLEQAGQLVPPQLLSSSRSFNM